MGGWRRRGAGIRGWVIHISSNDTDDFLLRSTGQACASTPSEIPLPIDPIVVKGGRLARSDLAAARNRPSTKAMLHMPPETHDPYLNQAALTQKLRYEDVVVLADLPPSYVSLSYHYQRNTATKDVGHSDHRHAMPERTDSLQIYSAISCEATTVSRQNQVIGMSALLLRQRPIDRPSRPETSMIARLRTAQVR
jgi:hypothetical protein